MEGGNPGEERRQGMHVRVDPMRVFACVMTYVHAPIAQLAHSAYTTGESVSLSVCIHVSCTCAHKHAHILPGFRREPRMYVPIH